MEETSENHLELTQLANTDSNLSYLYARWFLAGAFTEKIISMYFNISLGVLYREAVVAYL